MWEGMRIGRRAVGSSRILDHRIRGLLCSIEAIFMTLLPLFPNDSITSLHPLLDPLRVFGVCALWYAASAVSCLAAKS